MDIKYDSTMQKFRVECLYLTKAGSKAAAGAEAAAAATSSAGDVAKGDGGKDESLAASIEDKKYFSHLISSICESFGAEEKSAAEPSFAGSGDKDTVDKVKGTVHPFAKLSVNTLVLLRTARQQP